MITENNIRLPKRKKYQELTFTDDFMFRKVLRNNEEICKELIELLLDISIEHIEYKGDDYSIAAAPDSKSVRLDVYLNDEDGTVFDIEMQNANRYDLPKRSRQYQSMIDVDHLMAGDSYNDLPGSYIIFICMFDPFGKSMHKYEFRDLCLQDPGIELGAATSKVFINSMSRQDNMSEGMRAFLDFLCGGDASSKLTKDIAGDVAKAKSYKPWEVEYMQLNEMISLAEQDARRIGYEVGHAEGRAEGRAKSLEQNAAIIEYLNAQNRSDEIIRAVTDKEFREQLLEEMGMDE